MTHPPDAVIPGQRHRVPPRDWEQGARSGLAGALCGRAEDRGGASLKKIAHSGIGAAGNSLERSPPPPPELPLLSSVDRGWDNPQTSISPPPTPICPSGVSPCIPRALQQLGYHLSHTGVGGWQASGRAETSCAPRPTAAHSPAVPALLHDTLASTELAGDVGRARRVSPSSR